MENSIVFPAFRVYSENAWIFPDDTVNAFQEDAIILHCARGGNVLTQILTDLAVREGDCVSLQVQGANGIAITPYQLIPVTVTRNSAPLGMPDTTDDYESVKDFVTRQAPFAVYDATAPLNSSIAYTGRLALALRFTAASAIPAGVQEILCTLTIADTVLTFPVTLHIHKAVIPPMQNSKLSVVNWIMPGKIAEQAGCSLYEDTYWEVYKNILPHLTDIRNNHLSLAQTYRHEPDEAVRDETGKVIDFDLSKLEKALQLGEKAGMTKLYGSYIAHWEQWDQPEIYLLWDWDNKWRVTSTEAYRQLKLYFSRVREMVARNGWEDKYIQPLVDEPQFQNETDYRILCGVIRSIWPEIVIHDPVEVYNIAGAADIICVKQAVYERYLSQFQTLQDAGQRVTYYACGYPAGPTMNRVLDLPLFVGRISFWMCHKYRMEGYLHWGYHAYSSFENANNGLMAPGNANIVYAVGNDFWDSMRAHAQRSGAEDWELLAQIAEQDPQLCQQLIDRGCRSFDDYEKDSAAIDQIQLDILTAADRFS